MTMKITKTGRGGERNDETLLFEWLNHEVPESIKLSYETMLNTNKFAGSLQTNQIMGVYLEPITFSGEFFGEYISINNANKFEYITAKERSDQLSRLQGRIVKFWFEGIKQLVIIQKYEIDIKNYNHIEYTLTLQPHDIQLPINPIDVKQYLTKSFIQSEEKAEIPNTNNYFTSSLLNRGAEKNFKDTKLSQNKDFRDKQFGLNYIATDRQLELSKQDAQLDNQIQNLLSLPTSKENNEAIAIIRNKKAIINEEYFSINNGTSVYDNQLKNYSQKVDNVEFLKSKLSQ